MTDLRFIPRDELDAMIRHYYPDVPGADGERDAALDCYRMLKYLELLEEGFCDLADRYEALGGKI